MVIGKLIRCTACNQVIPNYGGSDLARAQSLPGVEWSNADLSNAKEFLRAHFGHRLEELIVEGDSCVSEKPSYETVRVTYFFAGNGKRRFLVRRTKSALDKPAFYKVISGRLKLSNVSLKIQEDDLRKQIAAEKGFSPLLKERMERFIQVFRDEIARISLEKFEEEAEEIDDGEGSTPAYAALKNSRWQRILNRCRLYFDEFELKVLNRFIDENRNPPDVLSIQIERRLSIISPGEAETSSLANVEMERKKMEASIEDQASANVEKKAAKGKL